MVEILNWDRKHGILDKPLHVPQSLFDRHPELKEGDLITMDQHIDPRTGKPQIYRLVKET